MLRLVVLVLVLLNGVYFAWSHDMLRAYGFGPAQQSEPQRLAQQIEPQRLVILPVDEARLIDAQSAAAGRQADCLQAGPFDDTQANQLRAAVEELLPSGGWQLEPVVEPARWIIYMGKYPDAQTLARKRAELAGLNLNLQMQTVSSPALVHGLSLGAYTTEARANTELAALNRRGVRTAEVLQERAESRASMLRLPVVDEGVRARLDELRPVLAGKSLRACS